jgi:hypothetical protein
VEKTARGCGDFRNLYSSPSIIRMMKSRKMTRAGNRARGTDKKYIHYFSWKTSKEAEDNNKMDLTGIGCGEGTTGSFLGSYEYSNEPSGSMNQENFLTSLATISFSNRTAHHGVSYRSYNLHSLTNRSIRRVLSSKM